MGSDLSKKKVEDSSGEAEPLVEPTNPAETAAPAAPEPELPSAPPVPTLSSRVRRALEEANKVAETSAPRIREGQLANHYSREFTPNERALAYFLYRLNSNQSDFEFPNINEIAGINGVSDKFVRELRIELVRKLTRTSADTQQPTIELPRSIEELINQVQEKWGLAEVPVQLLIDIANRRLPMAIGDFLRVHRRKNNA